MEILVTRGAGGHGGDAEDANQGEQCHAAEQLAFAAGKSEDGDAGQKEGERQRGVGIAIIEVIGEAIGSAGAAGRKGYDAEVGLDGCGRRDDLEIDGCEGAVDLIDRQAGAREAEEAGESVERGNGEDRCAGATGGHGERGGRDRYGKVGCGCRVGVDGEGIGVRLGPYFVARVDGTHLVVARRE
jgi:hypothetical protein